MSIKLVSNSTNCLLESFHGCITQDGANPASTVLRVLAGVSEYGWMLGKSHFVYNNDFSEKSFCTAVCLPKSFHMTIQALCSEIHQPTLIP